MAEEIKPKSLRQSLMDRLVEDSIDTAISREGSIMWLDSVFREGFIGFGHQTLKQLVDETEARFYHEVPEHLLYTRAIWEVIDSKSLWGRKDPQPYWEWVQGLMEARGEWE